MASCTVLPVSSYAGDTTDSHRLDCGDDVPSIPKYASDTYFALSGLHFAQRWYPSMLMTWHWEDRDSSLIFN